MMGNEICIVIKTIYKLKEYENDTLGFIVYNQKNQPRLNLGLVFHSPSFFVGGWLLFY